MLKAYMKSELYEEQKKVVSLSLYDKPSTG